MIVIDITTILINYIINIKAYKKIAKNHAIPYIKASLSKEYYHQQQYPFICINIITINNKIRDIF